MRKYRARSARDAEGFESTALTESTLTPYHTRKPSPSPNTSP